MSVEEEQVYDLLSQVNKRIMLRNGAFDYEDISNGECLCGHSESEHLIDLAGIADCCPYAKDKDLCICDKFLEEKSKVNIPPTIKGKLPSLQKKPEQSEDIRIESYVQMLSKI